MEVDGPAPESFDEFAEGLATGRGLGRGRGLAASVDISKGLVIAGGNLRRIPTAPCSSNSFQIHAPTSLEGSMSDSPVIFKRTKSKPSQRARKKSPDADDTATAGETSDYTSQGGGGGESPITLASKLKNKAKKAKTKSRLSFGGNDDEVRVSTCP